MKTWTTQNSRLSAGIALTNDEKLGKVIFLGESGRGRKFERVKLDGRRPPLTRLAPYAGETVEECDIVDYKVGDRQHFALTDARPGDARILVRVHCGDAYIRGGQGNAKPYMGSPRELISGYGAFGDAGRIGNWDDGLWVMGPGDAIVATPSRGNPWVIQYPTAGETPVIWSVGDFRAEVTAPWARSAKLEEVLKCLEQSRASRSKGMEATLAGALLERSDVAERLILARENLRNDNDKAMVVVDEVASLDGVFLRRENKPADRPEEAEEAAKFLSRLIVENPSLHPQVAVAKRLHEEATKVAQVSGGSIRETNWWATMNAEYMPRLMGCHRLEQALERDLSVPTDFFLSKEEIERVREQRPETVSVLGVEAKLDYTYASRPKAKVKFERLDPQVVLNATGILSLPDGTQILVCVEGDGWDAEVKNLDALVGRIRERANASMLQRWQKPPVMMPVELLESDEPPAILKEVCGSDVLTGEPVYAYGVYGFGYYGEVSMTWHLDPESAESRRQPLTPDRLESVRSGMRTHLENESRELARNRASEEASAAREELRNLQSDAGWNSLDHKLSGEADSRGSSSLPYSADELTAWTAETRELLGRLNAALAQLRTEREAAGLRRIEAGKRLLSLFSTHLPTCIYCGKDQKWDEQAVDAVRAVRFVRCSDSYNCTADSKMGTALQAVEAGHEGDTVRYDGRDATVLYRLMVGGKPAIQFAVYHKYGCWNFVGILDEDAAIADGQVSLETVWQPPSWSGTRLPSPSGVRSGVSAPVKADQASSASVVAWEEMGNRSFRCSCGATERVTKSDWKAFEAGKELTLTCVGCRGTGSIRKDTDPGATSTATTPSGGATLADLMGKFKKE